MGCFVRLMDAIFGETEYKEIEIDYKLNPFLDKDKRFMNYLYEKDEFQKKNTDKNSFGIVTLALDKEALSDPNSPHIKISNANELLKAIFDDKYIYFRPNTSFWRKSHGKDDIRWMVSFVLDFDKQHLFKLNINSFNELRKHVESFGYTVFAIIATTSGFHVWLPLKPHRGYRGRGQSIDQYNVVIKGLAKELGSDPLSASVEHFFRTPRYDNVVYFEPVSKPNFSFYKDKIAGFNNNQKREMEDINTFKENTQENSDSDKESEIKYKKFNGKHLNLKPFQVLFEGDIPAGVKGEKMGRNCCAYSMSIACRLDGLTQVECMKRMEDWYYNKLRNKKEFKFKEVIYCVNSAYAKNPDGSYKKKGYRKDIVEALSGVKFRPITEKKLIGERQFHFTEIEGFITDYLKEHKEISGGKDLEMSQPELAKKLSEFISPPNQNTNHTNKK